MSADSTPDCETIVRNLEALIAKQGNPEYYLTDEVAYLSGLKDALRIVNGEPPANDRSET